MRLAAACCRRVHVPHTLPHAHANRVRSEAPDAGAARDRLANIMADFTAFYVGASVVTPTVTMEACTLRLDTLEPIESAPLPEGHWAHCVRQMQLTSDQVGCVVAPHRCALAAECTAWQRPA